MFKALTNQRTQAMMVERPSSLAAICQLWSSCCSIVFSLGMLEVRHVN